MHIFNLYTFIYFYIHAGDKFSLQALVDNAENVDYYLLRCTKEKHKLLEGTIDADEQSYPIGLVVIEGTYYQKTRVTNSGIEFIEYSPRGKFLHYNNHVIATKLQFEAIQRRGRHGNQKWKLSIEEHEKLLEIIKIREDPNNTMFLEL